MDRQGLNAILAIGTPNQPLFDIPVGEGRADLIVNAGLNRLAALYETQPELWLHSLAEVEDIGRFQEFQVLRSQMGG